jgi:ribosomal protein S18 acetylase RimI-like enzyme
MKDGIEIKTVTLDLPHILHLSQNLPRDPFLKLLLLAGTQSECKVVCFEATLKSELVGCLLVGEGWDEARTVLKALVRKPLNSLRLMLSAQFLRSSFALIGRPSGYSIPSELLYISVDQAHRGEGLGSKMIQVAVSTDVINSGTWVRTLESSLRNIQMYTAAGFKIVHKSFGRIYLRFNEKGYDFEVESNQIRAS